MKRKNSGAVLPIVLVTAFVTQIAFYSILGLYNNHMQTYTLLINHYKTQTLFAISESYLADNGYQSTIRFNIGSVQVSEQEDETFILTSYLKSGYTETKIISNKQP